MTNLVGDVKKLNPQKSALLNFSLILDVNAMCNFNYYTYNYTTNTYYCLLKPSFSKPGNNV